MRSLPQKSKLQNKILPTSCSEEQILERRRNEETQCKFISENHQQLTYFPESSIGVGRSVGTQKNNKKARDTGELQCTIRK